MPTSITEPLRSARNVCRNSSRAANGRHATQLVPYRFALESENVCIRSAQDAASRPYSVACAIFRTTWCVRKNASECVFGVSFVVTLIIATVTCVDKESDVCPSCPENKKIMAKQARIRITATTRQFLCKQIGSIPMRYSLHQNYENTKSFPAAMLLSQNIHICLLEIVVN